MPIVSVPFEQIGVDLIGPLTLSSEKHRFVFVVVDYATCYLEAIPLHSATAAAVAHEMSTLFTRVGFPKEIVTDQGTVFMGKIKSSCTVSRFTCPAHYSHKQTAWGNVLMAPSRG